MKKNKVSEDTTVVFVNKALFFSKIVIANELNTALVVSKMEITTR